MQIAFIFARGGSKGVIRKNVRDVAGKPLIAHTIETALDCPDVDKIVVSTDCDEIASTSVRYGAEVLMRPEHLARDDSAEIDAWRHAIESYSTSLLDNDNAALFLSLPATSPLRTASDISDALENFREGACDVLFGITPSHRNPYLNMVEINADGYLQLVNEGVKAVRRQDVPEVYDVTTAVYVADPHYIGASASLMQGRVGYSIIPPERALDIDTEYDLYLADLHLRNPYISESENGE